MDQERRQIGHRLKVARVDCDLKQAQLGVMMGVTQAVVSDWERGRIPVPVRQLIRLAKILNRDLNYFGGFEKNLCPLKATEDHKLT